MKPSSPNERRCLAKLFERLFVVLGLIAALSANSASAADLAFMNQDIGQAIASDSCAKVGLWAMIAAQTYDYITSYRNFQNGYIEADRINRPFTQVFHNTKIGLAIGLATVDIVGMRLTQRSPALRCTLEVQRTAASVAAAIHNNAIGGGYRP